MAYSISQDLVPGTTLNSHPTILPLLTAFEPTLASLFFLEQTKPIPIQVALHLLFPLPRVLLPLRLWSIPSFHSSIYLELL